MSSEPPSPSAPGPAPPPDLLVVGRLVAAQGLAGELRVLPLSDFPERFTRPGPRWLQGKGQPAVAVTLRRGRQLPGRELFVVRLAGIDDRGAAEALVGHDLLVPASERPSLAPGEFHLLDLVGLEVRLLDDAAAAPIGTVRDLVHAGNDLLEVELVAAEQQSPGRRVYVPFVAAIVPVVQLEEGWIGLTPPPGLLDL
ncbi:MAG: ribosome maturation factor RimM [Cyanobium sp.]